MGQQHPFKQRVIHWATSTPSLARAMLWLGVSLVGWGLLSIAWDVWLLLAAMYRSVTVGGESINDGSVLLSPATLYLFDGLGDVALGLLMLAGRVVMLTLAGQEDDARPAVLPSPAADAVFPPSGRA